MQTAAVKFKDSSSGGNLPACQYNSRNSAEESHLYVEGSEFVASISDGDRCPATVPSTCRLRTSSAG